MSLKTKKLEKLNIMESGFFSVVDVVNILVESKAKDKGAYWRKLNERLIL